MGNQYFTSLKNFEQRRKFWNKIFKLSLQNDDIFAESMSMLGISKTQPEDSGK